MFKQEDIDKAFLDAANNNSLYDAQTLLYKGANIDAFDPDNDWTALAYFSFRGNLEAVKWLVGAGADIKAQSTRFKRTTALTEAAEQGHLDIVKFLLENGAFVDARDLYGRTILSATCHGFQSSNADVLRHLIENKADINAKDYRGYTPLMHLIGSSAATVESTKLFLENGADYSLADDEEGRTATQMCQDIVDQGYSKIHEELLRVLDCLKSYQDDDLLKKSIHDQQSPTDTLTF